MEQICANPIENVSRVSYVKPTPMWYRVYENKNSPTRDSLLAVDDGTVKNVQYCSKVIFASTKPVFSSTFFESPRPEIEPQVWFQVYGVLKESRDHVGRIVITIIRG